MSKPDSGGPAFPCTPEHSVRMNGEGGAGMTLRDYFAAMALQGTLASPQITGNDGLDNWRDQDFADFAYRLADAMLAVRSA